MPLFPILNLPPVFHLLNLLQWNAMEIVLCQPLDRMSIVDSDFPYGIPILLSEIVIVNHLPLTAKGICYCNRANPFLHGKLCPLLTMTMSFANLTGVIPVSYTHLRAHETGR